jgi:hypothetical protein
LVAAAFNQAEYDFGKLMACRSRRLLSPLPLELDQHHLDVREAVSHRALEPQQILRSCVSHFDAWRLRIPQLSPVFGV